MEIEPSSLGSEFAVSLILCFQASRIVRNQCLLIELPRVQFYYFIIAAELAETVMETRAMTKAFTEKKSGNSVSNYTIHYKNIFKIIEDKGK